ncbi:MAG: lipid A biosynthesis acyltransferase [Bacteroidetes bacterium]|nr:lipid A biosynthesis acyltransferase [Bacteroidota bacterium]
MSSWEGKTRGGALGYKIFVWTLKYPGLSFAYFLLSFVVIYFVATSGQAFKAIFHFYNKIMKYSRFMAFISIYRNYYMFGQILLDKVAMLAGFQQKFTFDFEGEEYLRQMDNGGLLVSAHVGNWEIAGQLLNRLEKRINIILFDAEHQRIKAYLSNVLTNRNVNFIIIRNDFSHLLQIREALANKEIVAMHGDRFIEGNKTATLDFMGKPAEFPVGPVNMAAKFKVPVSFVFAVKESSKHYHFYATPLHYTTFTTNQKQREENLLKAVTIYVRKLEEILNKYPLQWFNYYDFWKPVEPGKPSNQTGN